MEELTKRQKQIKRAALKIIYEKGIQNLTIKNLSTEIGITEGAIYRHFNNKEEILYAIVDLFKRSTTEILNGILESNLTPLKKIKKFFIGRCRQISEEKGLALVLFSDNMFRHNEKLQLKIIDIIKTHKKLIMKIIEKGQTNNKIRKKVESEHLFMIIMGSLRFLVSKWQGSNFSFDLIQEGSKLWNSIELIILIKNGK